MAPESLSTRIEQAEGAMERGRLDEATEALESLVPEAWLEPALRSRVLLGLGKAYGRAGRSFEAAVVARNLVRIERARRDEEGLATALALLVVALVNAKALDRAKRPLAELERRLEAAGEDQLGHLWRIAHQARLTQALLAGDEAEASRRYERIRALLDDGQLGAAERWYLRNIEFHVLNARDDLTGMERILEAVLSEAPPEGRNVYLPAITLRLGLAMAYARRGRLDDARRVGAQAVVAMRATAAGSEVLVDDGVGLFRLLHDTLDERDLAQETAERVTAALLERLRLVAESAPVLDRFLDEDDEHLRELLQDDFESTLVAFFAPLRQTLEPVGLAAREAPDREDLLCVCAWCGRVRLDRGWLPLRRFTRERHVGAVTHGICPTCSARLKREHGGPPATS